ITCSECGAKCVEHGGEIVYRGEALMKGVRHCCRAYDRIWAETRSVHWAMLGARLAREGAAVFDDLQAVNAAAKRQQRAADVVAEWTESGVRTTRDALHAAYRALEALERQPRGRFDPLVRRSGRNAADRLRAAQDRVRECKRAHSAQLRLLSQNQRQRAEHRMHVGQPRRDAKDAIRAAQLAAKRPLQLQLIAEFAIDVLALKQLKEEDLGAYNAVLKGLAHDKRRDKRLDSIEKINERLADCMSSVPVDEMGDFYAAWERAEARREALKGPARRVQQDAAAPAAAAVAVVAPVQQDEVDDEEPEPDWIEDGEVEELDGQLGPAVVEAMRAASVPAWYKRRLLWCVKGKPQRITGVLRCQNAACSLSGNRDELATRNQLIVVMSLLRGEGKPAQYRWAPADPRRHGGKKRSAVQLRAAEAVARAALEKHVAEARRVAAEARRVAAAAAAPPAVAAAMRRPRDEPAAVQRRRLSREAAEQQGIPLATRTAAPAGAGNGGSQPASAAAPMNVAAAVRVGVFARVGVVSSVDVVRGRAVRDVRGAVRVDGAVAVAVAAPGGPRSGGGSQPSPGADDGGPVPPEAPSRAGAPGGWRMSRSQPPASAAPRTVQKDRSE
ncbi:MAG: hypothetical protein ACK52I_12035, partial [Pseudomonadota bacterium]